MDEGWVRRTTAHGDDKTGLINSSIRNKLKLQHYKLCAEVSDGSLNTVKKDDG